MFLRNRLSLAAMAALCTAPFAAALNQDYYVHFGTFNGVNYVDTYVTPIWSQGTSLVKPPSACGLRFKQFDQTDWIFGNGFEFSPDFNVVDHDYIDVHLPSAGCGAWLNLVVEPHTHPFGEAALVSPPGDMPGMLYIPDAKAYWIDKDGNMLVYKHVCVDCSASNDLTYGSQGSVHGWIVVPEQLKTLTRVLGGARDLRGATTLLDLSQSSLQDLSREFGMRVTRRRSYNAGDIEPSLRALEDNATKSLNAAISYQLDCRAFRERSDLKSAANACQAAVDAVVLARGEIATAENWVVR